MPSKIPSRALDTFVSLIVNCITVSKLHFIFKLGSCCSVVFYSAVLFDY